jgi:GNAT superfamily N-acetyltransferase
MKKTRWHRGRGQGSKLLLPRLTRRLAALDPGLARRRNAPDFAFVSVSQLPPTFRNLGLGKAAYLDLIELNRRFGQTVVPDYARGGVTSVQARKLWRRLGWRGSIVAYDYEDGR